MKYSPSNAAHADKRGKYRFAQHAVYGVNGGKLYLLGHNNSLLQVLAGERFWRVASLGHCDLTDTASGRALGLFDSYRLGEIAGFVHIGTLDQCHVVSQELQWDSVQNWGDDTVDCAALTAISRAIGPCHPNNFYPLLRLEICLWVGKYI